MRKVWVLVANSSEAKIYTAQDVNTLVELKQFTHEESTQYSRDLTSDQAGMSKDMRSSMEEQTPPKVKERTHFALELAKFLEEGYFAGKFERLYLVASDPFLGFLRQSLNGNVSKAIETEVGKDLTQMRPAEIRKYLPPVL